MDKIIFWKDKQAKAIDPTLFSTRAESLAKAMAKDHDASKGRRNKRSQIRKFYDEVLRLETEAQSNGQRWPSVLPRVHMLTAKAAYANGRELVSDTFLGFIKASVDQIESVDDLSVWANFFEAFMGFYRLHGPRN